MTRFFAVICAAFFVMTGSAFAQKVEITLSDHLEEAKGRINSIEQKFEREFRDTRRTSTGPSVVRAERFNRSRDRDVQWAGERLIGSVGNYTLENLLKALVKDNLKRNDMDLKGQKIRVHLDALNVSGHSVAEISQGRTLARAQFELVDRNGEVIRSVERTAFLRPIKTKVNNDYDGAEYAFLPEQQGNRVGPILSQLAEAGLEALFEGTDFNGAVLIILV